MTPGLPTVRCTMSMFLFAAMAGVTVQFPRMLCRMAAAAPGWPLIVEYCAACANRPKATIPPISPSSTPSGIRTAAVPVTRPRTTASAMTPAAMPNTIGSALGLALRTMPATMRICFRRPTESASAAAFFDAAAPGLFTMQVRIRSRGPQCEMAASAGGSLAVHRVAVHRLAVQPASAVGRPDQRPGQHPREAELAGLGGQLVGLGGRQPVLDRVVANRRPQVLRDGEQVAPGGAQAGHRLTDLVPLLAQAQDEVGLGNQAGLPGPADHLERAVVAEAGPDPAEDPRHGLDVVREHLRAGLRVQPGAAVRQVIAGHPGDRRVAQAHGGHRPGHPARLVGVQRARLAGRDLAEVAAPGAHLAADQERGLAVFPALEDVRAAGFLADRVQALAAH